MLAEQKELQLRLILANALDMADNDSRYIPCVFSLSMPKASNDGNVSLSISIQNNSQSIMSLCDYYAKSRYPVFVTLEQWIALRRKARTSASCSRR